MDRHTPNTPILLQAPWPFSAFSGHSVGEEAGGPFFTTMTGGSMNLSYTSAEEVSFYLSEGCLTQDETVRFLADALKRIQELEELLEEERQSNVRTSSIASPFYHHDQGK